MEKAMHKVVYNACYGGFGLSLKAIEWLTEHTTDLELKTYLKEKLVDERKSFIGTALGSWPDYIRSGIGSWFDDKRHHKDLVTVVEALGKEANGAEDIITPNDSNWIFINN